jgi:hypothetical protein
MPQQILIQPAAREYGLHREQYQALATDLAGEGVLVRVVPAVEERGLRTGGSQNAGVSYDLTIQVGAVAGEIIGTAKLVEMVRGQLRRHDGREDEKRRGKIYLADGEEHAFVFGDGYE